MKTTLPTVSAGFDFLLSACLRRLTRSVSMIAPSVIFALLPACLPCLADPVAPDTTVTSPEKSQSAARHETPEETKMNNNDNNYTTSYTVDQSPDEVFKAISH